MKKIYFACSISGGRDHAHVYQDIVNIIKANNMHVLSELFADSTIKAAEGTKHKLSAPEIWEWDLNWVREADGVIAEVTQPSLGVGYEIAEAHEWGKPVLALYYPRDGHRLSSMISGSPNVIVCEYQKVAETEAAIRQFFASL